MFPLLGLLVVAAYGAIGVRLLGGWLRSLPPLRRRSSGWSLAAAHSLIVLGFLAVAPLYVAAMWGSSHGDVYVPYILVPGVHIALPANIVFGDFVSPALLPYLGSFEASVICVIVGPGLVGLVVGGVQWWLIGYVWDRMAVPPADDLPPSPPALRGRGPG